MSYCDGAGVAFLIDLQQLQIRTGGDATIQGLQEEFRRLLDIYGDISINRPPGRRREPLSIIEQVGKAAVELWRDLRPF